MEVALFRIEDPTFRGELCNGIPLRDCREHFLGEHLCRLLKLFGGVPRRSLSTQRKSSAMPVPENPGHQGSRDDARVQRKQVGERSEQQEEGDLS